ncbi:MAG: alpha amylase C-terminal domain-containing protein [Clostridia bacterium]|nr:alpha amylase C-terminal domain-containing protein [Clostridia bacterium]
MANPILKIIEMNPELSRFSGDLNYRLSHFYERKAALFDGDAEKTLWEFSGGAQYYGFHPTETGWIYREWAPGAKALFLTGDFNGWDRTSHPLKSIGNGNWEITLEGKDALPHLSNVKVVVESDHGREDRIPLYATYVTEDESHNFSATIWNPAEKFKWGDQCFSVRKNTPPLIYESHIGMATEEERVGTYREFEEKVLPRVKRNGYNTIQLMAIMEHPYYGSFGYQVSNFFAPSSRFGTPDDLRSLINTAHKMGISVLLDLVHSHAVKNTAEGISNFDGRDDQFFKEGGAGYHPAWDSRVFDYGKNGVVHFLLSNIRYWMESFHFDGFRFDGITSMIYLDHGLGTNFMFADQYFSMNTDIEAVTYLQLATSLIHEINPAAICIAEDMSAMPGMCLPIEWGGIGFDYRLSMGIPDFYIKTIKEKQDGEWEMSRLYWELIARRPGEKVIGYAESHDQALVGDKTIMFRLADKEMYYGMDREHPNLIIDRAVALHKMIRLATIGAGGDGYLNFMGNEFGHPEWIDFPREGNGWSYHHARRQWSLADNPDLKFQYLGDFDKAMIDLIREFDVLSGGMANCLRQHEEDQILIFEKMGCIFAFNFHPTKTQNPLFIPVPEVTDYRVILSTDAKEFGGYENIDTNVVYHPWSFSDQYGRGIQVYMPPRTAIVLHPCTNYDVLRR